MAAMTARVAALWRAQGEDFLACYDAGVVDDVERLRTAVIVETTLPRLDGERIKERLRRLDAAALERVAAGRDEAVLDLTGAEPMVHDDAAAADEFAARRTACRRCHRVYSDEFFVETAGDKVKPLCLDCAMVFAGVRRH
ncbi:MAG: hypothetical protein QOJ09_3086 [Actinomycetota bacterium]|nr:hypothetical protein [Actinomycetota bacterium]